MEISTIIAGRRIYKARETQERWGCFCFHFNVGTRRRPVGKLNGTLTSKPFAVELWSISRMLVTDRWLLQHTDLRAPFEAFTTYSTPTNLRARVTLACFLTNRKERTVSPCIGASIKVTPECKRPMTSGSVGCLASLLLALFLTSSEHPASARTIRVFIMLFDIVIAGAAGVRPDLPNL